MHLHSSYTTASLSFPFPEVRFARAHVSQPAQETATHAPVTSRLTVAALNSSAYRLSFDRAGAIGRMKPRHPPLKLLCEPSVDLHIKYTEGYLIVSEV